MRIDSGRLRRDLSSLARIGRAGSGGINRTSYSPADSEARRWYRERCVEAGLELRLDGLGNMFVRAPAYDRRPAPVWTGSHIDTVPDGGAFDGALGTVAALECVRRIAEERAELPRPVQAVVFADEEGNYGHLLGSTGLRRGYDAAQLASMTGRDEERLIDALQHSEWADDKTATATRIDGREVHAFIELHIEQGPKLESSHTDIGVVTAIVGLGGGNVGFNGRADHAGTTPMSHRRDALSAAAAFLLELPGLAAAINPDAVITCGMVGVKPGAANVVPGSVRLTLDFRDHDLDALLSLRDTIGRTATQVANNHRVTATWTPDPIVEPVQLDHRVQETINRSARQHGLTTSSIASGAGHDSQNMARLAPTGMIFVPSIAGRSHCPAERTDWADIDNGANVLLTTLLSLASQ